VLVFREFERVCKLREKKAPPLVKYVCVCKEISLLECAGTIGHVAHGKSTVVKAISGVQVILIVIPSIHHMLAVYFLFL